MVERTFPDEYTTKQLTSEQTGSLEGALENQGFIRLDKIPGITNEHQIPYDWRLFGDNNGRIVLIDQTLSGTGFEVWYSTRSSYLVDEVLKKS